MDMNGFTPFFFFFLSPSQMYASELQRAPSPHHKVTGGFHLNSKGIELALRVCLLLSVYGIQACQPLVVISVVFVCLCAYMGMLIVSTKAMINE